MAIYYHGSHTSGIRELEARSLLHNTDEKIVYLTDNIPYALLYVWDADHNKCIAKHVTGWTKNDIAYYEEQFPNQLRTLYQGVSGYLYCIPERADIKAVENRENMYYCNNNVSVSSAIYICDVYNELLKYEAEGKFVVARYNDQSAKRQEELIDFTAKGILRQNFYTENEQKQIFMKKHFADAWKRAVLMKQADKEV